MTRRILAVFLALLMVLAVLPVAAFAKGADFEPEKNHGLQARRDDDDKDHRKDKDDKDEDDEDKDDEDDEDDGDDKDDDDEDDEDKLPDLGKASIQNKVLRHGDTSHKDHRDDDNDDDKDDDDDDQDEEEDDDDDKDEDEDEDEDDEDEDKDDNDDDDEDEEDYDDDDVDDEDWMGRLDLPDYAEQFYSVISGDTIGCHPGSGGEGGVFAEEKNFVLPKASTGRDVMQVDRIEIAEFSLLDLFTGSGVKLDRVIFSDESFYTIPANAEDRKIDCTKLALGDVVTNANFNGVYVTKIPYDSSFDTQKKEACEYIAAVFHAFDRDHPEIFWLSGKCKARIMVAVNPQTKTKEAYFFLVLADKDGFTMYAPDWTATGSVATGIAQRDAAVANILKTVTAADPSGKVKQLNRWLTEHNQYNTAQDLSSVGNEPHECLGALKGQSGSSGPVCDGYSRAFKVLCDKLGIPCVVETGWSQATATGPVGFHMWNLVQIGGKWYGADITWNDPVVSGFTGPLSGRENENYLLVGSDTVINGLTFAQSHVVKNQAAVGGVDFNNGPVIGLQAYYSGIPAGDPVSAQTVTLDGKKVALLCCPVKDAGGNETNYVNLRDLALVLNGTKAQFDVGWDGKVSIIPNSAYTVTGHEGDMPYTGGPVTVCDSPVSFSGRQVSLSSFQLKDSAGNGYTYYKLRDLGQLLDFNVRWDGGVVIETDKPYSGR